MNYLKYLAKNVKQSIENLFRWLPETDLTEIRLRKKRPLEIVTINRSFFINRSGEIDNNHPYLVSSEDIDKTLLLISDYSLYALKKELQQGFITLAGGHRVGFTGEAVLEDNKIVKIKNINSLNFRLAREIKGIANQVVEKIINKNDIYNTLIIGPPLSGKTTLLRDLVRVLSNGNATSQYQGKKIGLIDERSEIAAAYQGVAQNQIGLRTDLLDKANKPEGILLLIRSMSPQIIAVDELGAKADLLAVRRAIASGVKIIATIHGKAGKNKTKFPYQQELIKIFDRYIFLENKIKPGQVVAIKKKEDLYERV